MTRSAAKRVDLVLMLAEYLTGKEVGHHSIGLEMPRGTVQQYRERAERFFSLREAFGVDGYMDAFEAKTIIAQRLTRRRQHAKD